MKNNRRNLYILVFVLFVVMLGYGIVIPILPFYIDTMGAGGTELGLLVASYAVMRLVFGPVWGSLSDRIGRKPVLLVGILGYAITMLWFGLASRLWMLFAARILSGVLSSATAPTTLAFISDSTGEKERGGGMGLMGAAAGIGTIAGPALGGLLADQALSTPFFIAAGLSGLALLLAALFLPESLPEENRSTTRREAMGSDKQTWILVIRSRLGLLFLLTFISTSGLMIFANVFGLYALERFSYGPKEVGMIMMVLGLVSTVAQGILAGPLTKRLGDSQVIKASLAASAVSLGLMVLANNYLTVLLTTALFGLTIALQTPSLISLTSRHATIPQGTAMGLSNSFISLGRIVGPVLGGLVFDLDIRYPYLLGSLIMGLGFLLSLVWIRPQEGAVNRGSNTTL
ncbi:MAG: MFS transporter [Anaerolineales bacterium]|nr:MFS transporter [Anaerolineales bacterium]